MKKLKLINISCIFLFIFVMIYITFVLFFRFIRGGLITNYFHLPDFFFALIPFFVSVLLIAYLFFLIRSKLSYKTWVKSSAILNLIGAIFFIIILLLNIVSYLGCISLPGEGKCLSFFWLGIYLGLFGAGFFLIIGFILLIIGIIKNKKN